MAQLINCSGTCNLGYIYNLGGQHGHRRMELAEFANELNRLIQPGVYAWFICATNDAQTHERKMLDALGFVSAKAGRMMSHTISHHEFRRNYKEKDFNKEERELKEKKRLAREEALKNRPRDENGRLLRKDGKIARKPYEVFKGDKYSVPYYALDNSLRNGWSNTVVTVDEDHRGYGTVRTDYGVIHSMYLNSNSRVLSAK